MTDSDRLRRLNWLCRRGMKELDLLLEYFLAHNQEQLSAGAWPELEGLLAEEDDVLWMWIQKPSLEPGARHPQLLKLIRGGRE